MNPSPRRQLGAASLTMILAVSLAVVFAALAVDTGRLGLESRRLQNIADLAAIDALSEAGLCAGVTTIDPAAVNAAAVASAVRNGFGGAPSDVAAQLGSLEADNGLYAFNAAAGGYVNAVKVTVARDVTSSLVAGGWLGGDTSLRRQAVAYDEIVGAFSAATELVAVDNDAVQVLNALLGALLEGGVSLTAGDYEQLVASEVTLEELVSAAAAAGVGSGEVSAFLQASLVPREFLLILAAAATTGSPAYAALSALAALSANTGTIALDDLISVTSENPQVAATAALNVFDLVTGGAQLANKGGTVSFSAAVNLPLGLSTITVDLHILEGPEYAIGPPGIDADGAWMTQTRTAQVQLVVRVPLDATPILGGVVRVSGSVPLYLELLSTNAWLETIRCANAASVAHQVAIGARMDGGALGVGEFAAIGDPASAKIPAAALQLEVSGGLISVNTNVAAAVQSASAADREFDFVASKTRPLPQTLSSETSPGQVLSSALGGLAGSLSASLQGGSGLDATLAVAGLSSADLASGLTDELLSPLLLALDGLVLDPLLQGLGIRFGAVEVTLHSVERNEPQLRQ